MSTPSSPVDPSPADIADPEHPVVLEATAAVPGETTSRVGFTGPAVALLQELWEQHGPLMFHQSGGCCDGSSPMCFPAGEFRTGAADVLLGTEDFTACSMLLDVAAWEQRSLGRKYVENICRLTSGLL